MDTAPETRDWMSPPTSLALVDRKLWQRSGWRAGWAEVVSWSETAQPLELEAVTAAEARLAAATDSAAIELCHRDVNQSYYRLDVAFNATRPKRAVHTRGAGVYRT